MNFIDVTVSVIILIVRLCCRDTSIVKALANAGLNIWLSFSIKLPIALRLLYSRIKLLNFIMYFSSK
jgi:hypothetical protein